MWSCRILFPSCVLGINIRFFLSSPTWSFLKFSFLTEVYQVALVVQNTPCRCRHCKKNRFSLWAGKIPCSRKWQPIPIFLPEKFHGLRSLAGYSPWNCKELDMAKWLNFVLFEDSTYKWYLSLSDLFHIAWSSSFSPGIYLKRTPPIWKDSCTPMFIDVHRNAVYNSRDMKAT